MTRALLAAVLLAAPAIAADEPVPPVSRWESLPRLAYRPDYKPRILWVQKARALEGSEGCALPDADAEGVVRLRVPFVVRLTPAGKVVQAQAEMPGCPALAALVVQFATALGPRVIEPASGPPPLWRTGAFLAGWKR